MSSRRRQLQFTRARCGAALKVQFEGTPKLCLPLGAGIRCLNIPYEELEAGRSVDVAIATILRESRSLAFIGVLLTVGKRYPELLLGPLKPLLFILRLYFFDQQMVMQYNANGPNIGEQQWEQEATRQWEMMEHRRLSRR